MPLDEFIIWVYCVVEDAVRIETNNTKLRSRGFAPSLSDSETITIEIVGEFLGIDTDKGIWKYFCQHWRSWFPGLGSRAAFAKQTANLWAVKRLVHAHLVRLMESPGESIHIVDGFPIPVCKFRRAKGSRRLWSEAAYGYCASKGETYYGLLGHVIINFSGVIVGFTATPANVDEREALWELLPGIQGLVLGDKGFIGQPLKDELAQDGIQLETPLRKNMKDERDPSFVKTMMSVRRLVETVIGQLADRFKIEKVWARDMWHFVSRLNRKIVAHTMCVYLNRKLGREPLQFDGLVQA